VTLSAERRDRLYAWGGALLFHAVLGLCFFLIAVAPPVVHPDVVEVSFLPEQVPSRSDSLAVRSGAMLGAGAKGVTGSPALSAKAHKGSGGPTPGVQRVTVPAPSHGKETPLHSTRSGGTVAGKAPVNKNASVRPKPAETGSTALGSWQWTSGGKRKKISGVLPAYPAGVTATAQIKMEVMVAPNGHVRSVRPAQKGNAHFEEAASRELHKWRFEPLPRSFPQRDQRCLVIINFSFR
jgi:hypothetical protein